MDEDKVRQRAEEKGRSTKMKKEMKKTEKL
jgi:hypothetical protein